MHLQPQKRSVAYRALDELHTARNRITHHEPIHHRNVIADALTIYQVLGWIDADVRAWAVGISRLGSVISAQPP